MTLLDVRGLGVTFSVGGGWRPKSLVALDDLSFTLQRGEILAVVGESGSGKSTLARLLTRLEKPTRGEIFLDGRNVLKGRASLGYRKRVQMVFQDPFGSLNPVHTVRHHLQRPLSVHGRDASEGAIKALLESVGLGPAERYIDALPHALSGGQRQRVAIARALAPGPELLIADEPTSMLDVSIRMDVLRLLRRLRDERDLAIILITHDLAAARYLADRVLVFYAGRLMEDAPASTLGTDPQHPYAQLLVAAAPRPGADLTEALPARSGLPPNVEPPPGCLFAERCLQVHDRCRVERPALSLSKGHQVACHLYEDDS